MESNEWVLATMDWLEHTLRHTRVMVYSILVQHRRFRSLVIHALRSVAPIALLALMYWAHCKANERDLKENPLIDVDRGFDILFGLCCISTVMMGLSFYVGRLVADTETGLRHLMHVSGLSRTGYWLAMAGVEGFLQSLCEVLLVAIVGSLFLRIRVASQSSPVLVFTSLVLVTASAVLCGCFVHMVFRTQRTSNIIAGTLSIIVSIAVPVYGEMYPPIPEERQPWWVLVCPVLPSYHTMTVLTRACEAGPEGPQCLGFSGLWSGPVASAWGMMFGASQDVVQRATHGGEFSSLVNLVILQHLVMWPLVLVLDVYHHRPLRRHQASGMPNGVASGDSCARGAMLEVSGLVHWYSTLPNLQNPDYDAHVLKGVSFCVAPGAMLGLLGPNGAGKTTAIRCITGEEVPREGSVSVSPQVGGSSPSGGLSPSENSRESDPSLSCASVTPSVTQRSSDVEDAESQGHQALLAGRHALRRRRRRLEPFYLGLCPQETALHADLSVEEHLNLFAGVRGAVSPNLSTESILQAIRLEGKRFAVPYELSGGMRRRLAIGCSMVGQPVLALLDEPSTGLDPVARRGVWEAVMEARNAGTACLLTTHMLEEAEELCTYIVILTAGVVAAEGSVQHLKEKWSQGYMLSVDAHVGEDTKAREYVASLLPEHLRKPVKSSLHGQMIFSVSRDTEFVGNLFLTLAREAGNNGIRHWGISQASLEDAYLEIIGKS